MPWLLLDLVLVLAALLALGVVGLRLWRSVTALGREVAVAGQAVAAAGDQLARVQEEAARRAGDGASRAPEPARHSRVGGGPAGSRTRA